MSAETEAERLLMALSYVRAALDDLSHVEMTLINTISLGVNWQHLSTAYAHVKKTEIGAQIAGGQLWSILKQKGAGQENAAAAVRTVTG